MTLDTYRQIVFLKVSTAKFYIKKKIFFFFLPEFEELYGMFKTEAIHSLDAVTVLDAWGENVKADEDTIRE